MNAAQRRKYRRAVRRQFLVGALVMLKRAQEPAPIYVVTENDPGWTGMWARCIHILPTDRDGKNRMGLCCRPSELRRQIITSGAGLRMVEEWIKRGVE